MTASSPSPAPIEAAAGIVVTPSTSRGQTGAVRQQYTTRRIPECARHERVSHRHAERAPATTPMA